MTSGGVQVKHEASYICDACGEEIVVPIDMSGAKAKEVAVRARKKANPTLRY
jgi:hypothetical protein